MSNNRSGVFIGGVLSGAAVINFTGLLMAPRTGRERQLVLVNDALPELAEDLLQRACVPQADRPL